MTLENLQIMKRTMDENCMYDGQSGKSMLVGAPLRIPKQWIEHLQNQVGLIAQWVKISIELYKMAIKNPEWFWLRDLIEKDASPKVIEWSRAFTLSPHMRLPALARGDLSTYRHIVELQVPGSGWGGRSVIHPEFPKKFSSVLQSIMPEEKPILYLNFNHGLHRDASYAARLAGIDIVLRELPHDWKKYGLVRRQFIHQIVETPHGEELLQAALDGKIVIEPTPSLLFDQKIMVLFPFHQKTREFYSDEIRGLFPETQLIEMNGSSDSKPMIFGENKYTVGDIVRLSKNKRNFVLKYGGSLSNFRSGGHGVFRLLKATHVEAEEYVSQALGSNKPWLIQTGQWEKHPVTFLNENGELTEGQDFYVGYRPMYSLHPEPKLLDLVAFLRPTWKIHGASDAITVSVQPTPDSI